MRGVIRFRAGALRETRHSTSASTSPAACFLDRSGVVRDSHLRLRALAGAACSFHSSSRDRSETLGTAAKLPDAEPVAPVPPQQRRLTVADVLERRAKAGRLVAPTAAYSDADMFKAPTIGKPKAKRWDHHLSQESLLREPCKLKQAAKHLKKPGLISLGGGLPCPEYFPIESLSMRVSRASNFSPSPEPSPATALNEETVQIGKYDATHPPQRSEYDLSIGLNYGQANGSAQLMRFVTEHVELVGLAPPYADWRTCLTVGSTSALETALRMLCDGPGRGDALLTEEYSFSTALETAAPLGVKVVGVPMDDQGLLPEEMDRILRNWPIGTRRPHVLYTVPSGQNPTGATQGEARRREIYEVCRKHDVFIIEDEPYYYLQMQAPGTAPPRTVDEFVDSLIPSLLSMDVDGRVLRMDSFSKVVVPGARLGWVTASEQIVERYIRHAEVANQGPSGFSQVIMHKLLDETWGHEGYLRWLMHLRMEYTKRRNVIVAACERFLPREIVSWNSPQAGMFHWLKINHELHPHSSSKSILEIEEEIFDSCLEKGVLVARGSWFRAEQDTAPRGLFFRATFAAATPENMTEAIRRFGEAIRESYKL